MKIFKFSFLLSFLCGCYLNLNPTGGNSTPKYPYFITKETSVVKKITVPKGTKLIYEEHSFKEGEQCKIMNEQELITIQLPMDTTIEWGGVPITQIHKFFNGEMRGFSVYPDFRKLDKNKMTEFSRLWESCSNDLGITIKNTDDWSFNKKNILDIESCSVNYQRYFKNDIEQQSFLNKLYNELKKVSTK